jgi:hypothetical protein
MAWQFARDDWHTEVQASQQLANLAGKERPVLQPRRERRRLVRLLPFAVTDAHKEHYSKPHVIEKKKSPLAASNASK